MDLGTKRLIKVGWTGIRILILGKLLGRRKGDELRRRLVPKGPWLREGGDYSHLRELGVNWGG